MVQSTPFVLDDWLRQHRPHASATLHDTAVAPLSLAELAALADPEHDRKSSRSILNLADPISYGPTLGKSPLIEEILSLYESLSGPPLPELGCIITSGCISANFLILDTLLGPGDHVICQYPCYQQFFEVSRRAGAEVTLWRSRPENRWMPDVSELSSLAKPSTKLIIINTPNNPTGAVLPAKKMSAIVDFAKERGIIVMCDEVFRPLYHSNTAAKSETDSETLNISRIVSPADVFPSILSYASKYKNIIATSSLSKSFSLPGIRVGWIAGPNQELLHQITLSRDYTTIAVGQIDQDIATFALMEPVRSRIIQRNLSICDANLKSLTTFVEKHSNKLEWVTPEFVGGSACFLRVVEAGLRDSLYCEQLISKTGLLIPPGGWAFGNGGVDSSARSDRDFEGYLRIGFACLPEHFNNCLELWGTYLSRSG